MAATGYAGMNVKTEARDQFRLAVAVTTGVARRKITNSEMLIALSKWVLDHPTEAAALLDTETKNQP